MLIKLIQNADNIDEIVLKSSQHALFLLDSENDCSLPFSQSLQAKLKRSKKEYKDLVKSPVTVDLPTGGLASFVILDEKLSTFQRHTLLRKAVKPLLDEQAT
ncbi:MAG TPA: leucyl aminopeptidase family protein, partial [Methylotenera sp.]|nr:leucyl aminopeptidase family protein [Methylotenera sp.]